MEPTFQAAIMMATVIGIVGALLGALIVFALVYMTLERMKGPLAVGLMIVLGIFCCMVSYGLGRLNQSEPKTVELVREKECPPSYVPVPLWRDAPVVHPRTMKKPCDRCK